MILVLGFLACLAIIATGLVGAVMAGANAYAGWRSDRRQSLLADPYMRPFYSGEYRSPFPWHHAASSLKPVKKDTAA